MKRILSVILVLTIAACMLTGCGASMEKINENTNIVVATIGNQDIYAYELIYLMKSGLSKEDALSEMQTIKTYVEKAAEYNVALTSDDLATVDTQWGEICTQYGGEENFVKELENYGITAEQYKQLFTTLSLVDKFYAEFENLNLIEKTSDETVLAFYDKNMLRAKHILFTTVDDAGQPLSEDEVKAKKEKAEATLAKIRAGASFESLANLSEDPGSQSSPDGYTFVNTQSDSIKGNEKMINMLQQIGIPMMVKAFEEGTANIAVDEVSEIVESEYGYHIIKRLDNHGEGNEFEQMKPALVYVIDAMAYDVVVEGWKADLKQKTNKYYEVLTVEPATPTQQTQTNVEDQGAAE